MKKLLVAIAFGLMAIAAQAEATFEQIQVLIEQKNYSAAEKGLETIIQNHPKSAKAFYAMAQAQAGLGNQEKAQRALDIATGLNPTLDFAPASSVANLKQAITPQVAKIEAIEESHFWRNTIIALALACAIGFGFMTYMRKEQEAEDKAQAERDAELDRIRAEREQARRTREAAEDAVREKLRQHPNYGNDRFDPTNPDVLLPKKTKAELKAEADAIAEMNLREAQYQAKRAEQRARDAEAQAASIRSQPTVIHTNNSSGTDLLTGVLIGNMMSGGNHHSHDTTIVRETVREVPAKSSSWDDTPAPARETKSSTWDDAPSKSSSWDDSSSKSSSSWSSSSSSDSSSSWDSGSSSSSDSSSSSSWD